MNLNMNRSLSWTRGLWELVSHKLPTNLHFVGGFVGQTYWHPENPLKLCHHSGMTCQWAQRAFKCLWAHFHDLPWWQHNASELRKHLNDFSAHLQVTNPTNHAPVSKIGKFVKVHGFWFMKAHRSWASMNPHFSGLCPLLVITHTGQWLVSDSLPQAWFLQIIF